MGQVAVFWTFTQERFAMSADSLVSRSIARLSSGNGPGCGQTNRWRAVDATAAIWILTVSCAAAADSPPVREHVFLPPTRGATVLSTYIDAQARYIAAVGDFLESDAIARRHRAEAFDREMDNALKWVETYFERRALNKAYRLKEDPTYLERARKQREVKKDVVLNYPDEVQKGEPSLKLNWLLNEIANTSLAFAAIYGADDRYLDSEIDLRLLPGDAHHIWLTEVAALGQKVPFRASDAKVFGEDWPLVFRAAEFQPARRAFEEATEKGLAEIHREGAISPGTFGELRQAVDGLRTELERTYPKEKRKSMTGLDWVILYDQGRRFVDSQAAAVMRAAATNRMETFDGSNRFDGDSVFDLIRHMCHRGLIFAPQQPGDEPTYSKLLAAMVRIYKEFQSLDSTDT